MSRVIGKTTVCDVLEDKSITYEAKFLELGLNSSDEDLHTLIEDENILHKIEGFKLPDLSGRSFDLLDIVGNFHSVTKYFSILNEIATEIQHPVYVSICSRYSVHFYQSCSPVYMQLRNHLLDLNGSFPNVYIVVCNAAPITTLSDGNHYAENGGASPSALVNVLRKAGCLNLYVGFDCDAYDSLQRVTCVSKCCPDPECCLIDMNSQQNYNFEKHLTMLDKYCFADVVVPLESYRYDEISHIVNGD